MAKKPSFEETLDKRITRIQDELESPIHSVAADAVRHFGNNLDKWSADFPPVEDLELYKRAKSSGSSLTPLETFYDWAVNAAKKWQQVQKEALEAERAIEGGNGLEVIAVEAVPELRTALRTPETRLLDKLFEVDALLSFGAHGETAFKESLYRKDGWSPWHNPLVDIVAQVKHFAGIPKTYLLSRMAGASPDTLRLNLSIETSPGRHLRAIHHQGTDWVAPKVETFYR